VKGYQEVVFAAEATFISGAGHLRRSMSFAEALDPKTRKFHIGQIEIEWLLAPSQEYFDSLDRDFVTLVRPLIILDSYDFVFCQYIRDLFPTEKIIQVADRFTTVLDDANIIWLDFPDGEQFQRQKTQILDFGLKLMPIRKMNRLFDRSLPKAKNVLVTTGGNPSLVSLEILCGELSRDEYKGVEFHFIGENPDTSISLENFHFYKPGIVLEALSAKVDTVITACGTSLWDFLANGFCVGAINLVENQSRNFEYVVSSNHAIPVNLNQRGNQLSDSLQSLFFDVRVRKKLVDETSRIYDFEGAQRFAKIIEALSFADCGD
jgi:spore coat polysaccharide biosynthesis predicted glycosyltransferase SpsG